jgi:uncharacterized membrane protein
MGLPNWLAIATHCEDVTKSDDTIVNCQSVYVGGAGNVAVIPINSTAAVTFTAVPAGTWIPVACKKIMSTNTTATLMIAAFI